MSNTAAAGPSGYVAPDSASGDALEKGQFTKGDQVIAKVGKYKALTKELSKRLVRASFARVCASTPRLRRWNLCICSIARRRVVSIQRCSARRFCLALSASHLGQLPLKQARAPPTVAQPLPGPPLASLAFSRCAPPSSPRPASQALHEGQAFTLLRRACPDASGAADDGVVDRVRAFYFSERLALLRSLEALALLPEEARGGRSPAAVAAADAALSSLLDKGLADRAATTLRLALDSSLLRRPAAFASPDEERLFAEQALVEAEAAARAAFALFYPRGRLPAARVCPLLEAVAQGALEADGPRVARAAPALAAEGLRLRALCAALAVGVLEIDRAMEALAQEAAAAADGGGGAAARGGGVETHYLCDPATLTQCATRGNPLRSVPLRTRSPQRL